MADTSVTERRVRPIQDAIAAGNWKQALKECEKWQKKGEASDRFLALKAAVLLRQPDGKNQEKGTNETLQLCRRQTPVLNIEAIHQLQDSLSLLHLDAQEGPKLWERAVAAQPSDKDLVETWLNNSIAVSDWQSAQKATMALKKAFPKERQYDFWNILMCYLIHEDKNVPEKDRKLFGTLANRMISKAAQSGPPEKMVSNPEELSLLAAVLVKTGSTSELVSLLQGTSLKSVTEQDRPHADSLLLMAVESNPEFPESENILSQMLTSSEAEAEVLEDDRVWSLFVKSAIASESRRKRIEQLDTILTKQPRHRQALLAKIEVLAHDAKEDSNSSKKLLDACQQYYEAFGSKAFCFDDLIQRLRIAGAETVSGFQGGLNDEPPSSTPSARSLFLLKLEYYLLCTAPSSARDFPSFASKALDLYLAAQGNESIAAEAVFLAALALLRLAYKSGDSAALLQSSMVLHTAHKKFKDYYPLHVLLVQVQMASGQIHLAMDNFAHLSVKNMQWETVGHLLLTRISTLHPRQHGRGDDSLNPSGALDTALYVSGNSQRSVDRAIADGLKQGSYSNVIGTAELKNNLRRSLNRQLYMIEQCKIQRALGLAAVHSFDPYEDALTDLRDMSFMPTYGVEDQDLALLLQCGPRPGQGWVNSMAMHECLLTYLMAELGAANQGAPGQVVEMALDNLVKAESRFSAHAADLTADEQEAAAVYHSLTTVVLQLGKKKDGTSQDLDKVIEAMSKPTRETKAVSVNGVQYPDAKWLHHRFVKLEMLQTAAHFAAIMSKKLKTGKGKKDVTEKFMKSLEELRPMINKQAEAIYSQARELKQGLGASGVLGKLVDVMLGRADGNEDHAKLSDKIATLQDEADVEEYCGGLRESWEDALDGVLAVKIKTI
ncbi:hypothetical protein OHC33_007249 [Knufia fluminis]|uniref:Uncharacterized protein n=1 Tax=Knufia fluminis TaxID=191047 RepID=A0AAN8EQ36_9EURO|nr:hypothetical protein OHC33_007249 [Knufia fluminis]